MKGVGFCPEGAHQTDLIFDFLSELTLSPSAVEMQPVYW